MKGTEKQVKWANDIANKAVKFYEDAIANLEGREDGKVALQKIIDEISSNSNLEAKEIIEKRESFAKISLYVSSVAKVGNGVKGMQVVLAYMNEVRRMDTENWMREKGYMQ